MRVRLQILSEENDDDDDIDNDQASEEDIYRIMSELMKDDFVCSVTLFYGQLEASSAEKATKDKKTALQAPSVRFSLIE